MKRPAVVWLWVFSVAIVLANRQGRAGEPTEIDRVVAEVRRQVQQAEDSKQFCQAGRDGWLFFVPEIRSLTVGPFWGEHAGRVSRAAKVEYADPLPAMRDFHEQLRSAGIELLVVPVPAKAAIYAEQLDSAFGTAPADWRLDADHAQFLDVLRTSGVAVLDLSPTFRQQKPLNAEPLFCRTDTHWSGRGVTVAAQVIAQAIRDRPWAKSLPRDEFQRERRSVTIVGDLVTMTGATPAQVESLTIHVVRSRRTGQTVPTSAASPVLLMGDSHTLVFHDPTLHAAGAGLPDQLASELGFPVDLLGVRGSGSTATRLTLLREKQRLVGKRLIIWCFATRDFTESRDGWRKIPLPKIEN